MSDDINYKCVCALSVDNTEASLVFKADFSIVYLSCTLIHKSWGCLSYYVGVEKAVLVPLKVLSAKTSSAGALKVPTTLLVEGIQCNRLYCY